MNTVSPNTEPLSLAISDTYYALFRHKTKILLCLCAGVLLGFALHRLMPAPFESEAKLFIRYVSEAKSLAAAGVVTTAKSPDQRGETILDSEMEIISSFDLARQVAEAIGPEAIIAPFGGPVSVNRAAAIIKADLKVETPPRSSVIRLIFRHPNEEVVRRVLPELIERYLRMHLEIHRAVGIIGDFLAQETNQFQTRLAQTEDELRKARKKAGVVSIDDTRKAYTEQIAAIRHHIFATQAELAERTSILEASQKRSGSSATPVASRRPDPIPTAVIDNYRNVVARATVLGKLEQDLLLQFREEHSRVKDVRSQRAAAENTKRELEEKYPQLISPALPALAPVADTDADAARIGALEAKIKVLNSQLAELRAEATAIDEIEPQMLELRRKKELDEANYRYYASSLEQARIDEALGAGRVSNISEIQTPSPPTQHIIGAAKLMGLLGMGGIFVGVGWAFLIERYLDRTVKRRVDVERILRPPLFLSIPDFGHNGHATRQRALLPPDGERNGVPRLTAPVAFDPFNETLRDRLIGYFESKSLTHKPKLVAVTGIDAESGVSTIAAGLARSLSEIGEGNVLLVDMTIGQESARQFIHGKPVCDLDQVLDARDPAKVGANLFVAAGNTNRDRLACNWSQRFSKLAPRLKASSFDYIIFDLPAVSPISITTRLASFMDMVLLVVQSEKTEQSVLERATTLLAEANAPIGVVLNKTRAHVPSWLKQEFIGDS